MAFVLATDRIRSAVDSEAKTRMDIDSTPQVEWWIAKFSSENISLQIQLNIQPKSAHRQSGTINPNPPGAMISARSLNESFAKQKMIDVEYNTELAKYIVHMIAFISNRYPLADSPILWSDYDQARPPRWLYRMPSNDELLLL
jgi:hypothetical protein